MMEVIIFTLTADMIFMRFCHTSRITAKGLPPRGEMRYSQWDIETQVSHAHLISVGHGRFVEA